MCRLTNDSQKHENAFLKSERTIHWRCLFIVGLCWAIVLAFSIMKGSNGITVIGMCWKSHFLALAIVVAFASMTSLSISHKSFLNIIVIFGLDFLFC